MRKIHFKELDRIKDKIKNKHKSVKIITSSIKDPPLSAKILENEIDRIFEE